jgi:hypothetical protein
MLGLVKQIVYLNRCAAQTFELEYVRPKKLNYHISTANGCPVKDFYM